MTTKLKAAFAAAFLSLGCATLTACVPQPADTASSDLDEAIGIPGADPYAFYVFNRQNVVAEQQPEALPPVVCVCFDEIPGSTVRREAETTAELRPR
jgi:hypothetical protein